MMLVEPTCIVNENPSQLESNNTVKASQQIVSTHQVVPVETHCTAMSPLLAWEEQQQRRELAYSYLSERAEHQGVTQYTNVTGLMQLTIADNTEQVHVHSYT